MVFAVAMLFAALTRAELIDQLRSPPIVQVDGLVQVRAMCNAAMRRSYQLPVAGFAADVCRRLYAADNLKERHFAEPGIVIVLGDVTTNLTNVVTKTAKRSDGTPWTKILVPAPGYADMDAFRLAVVKGYCRAVRGEDPDDLSALAKYRAADPDLKLADEYRALAEWYEGRGRREDDEEMLRLQRAVLRPGVTTKHDVDTFASRLYLYPEYFDEPFAGGCDAVSYREAIALAKTEPRVREAARRKIQEAVLYSGGRGKRLAAAGLAYAAFLNDLAAGVKSDADLAAELDAADYLLKGALDEKPEDDNRFDR